MTQLDWYKWLNDDECVRLVWLVYLRRKYVRVAKYKQAARREYQYMRIRAIKRRKRNDPRYAIYQRAMGD